MAVTGDYWDLTNPAKPLGELDPQDKLDIPMDWTDWLLEIGATLASSPVGFTCFPQVPLQVLATSQVDSDRKGVFRVAVDPLTYDPGTHLKKVFEVRCHIVASDGQEKDQTLYFKIVKH